MDESAILSARKRRGLVYRVHWLFGLKKHENPPKDARQTKQLPEIGTFLWESFASEWNKSRRCED